MATADSTDAPGAPRAPPAAGITPKDHAHAMSLPDAEKWRQSEIAEYHSHVANKTIGPPTHLPPGFKPKPAGWAYKIKRDGRYKSRVVIRGYMLVPGIDYNETHAPVVKVTTLRALLAVACSHGWTVKQADIETAFLSAPMDTEVYITLPPAWADDPSLGLPNRPSTTVHRLLKSIPGIPQGSRLHHRNFVEAMHRAGLRESPYDPCLFKHMRHRVYIAVWVDDFIIVFPPHLQWLCTQILEVLRKRFTIAEVTPLGDLLSMNIAYDQEARVMTLSQEPFATQLLKRSGMAECNSVTTPMPAAAKLTKMDCPSTPRSRRTCATRRPGTGRTWPPAST